MRSFTLPQSRPAVARPVVRGAVATYKAVSGTQWPARKPTPADPHSRARNVTAAAFLGGLGNVFKGDPTKKTRERLQPIVDQVNAMESQMQGKSDEELRDVTSKLRQQVQSGTSLDDVLPEAFAVRCVFAASHLGVECLVAAACHKICSELVSTASTACKLAYRSICIMNDAAALNTD